MTAALDTPLDTVLGTAVDTAVDTAPAALPETVLEAVRTGRTAELPGLLKHLDRAGRRTLLDELKQLRREMRGWDWDRWHEREARGRALLIAGAACHTGAAAAAAWIGARDLRTWQDLPADTLLDLLSDRDPKWLGDLAHRLAGRAATARQDYPLISELVRHAACPVPLTDAYVEGWAAALAWDRPGSRAGVPLELALRRDPHVRDLVPRLFETAEPVDAFAWLFDPENPHHWPSALAALAEDGCVDRATLVDGCIDRLLRGGKPAQLKYYLVLLQRLDPTQDEERQHTADWLALASDAPSATAGYAQQTLARLAEAGLLDTGLLTEMTEAVLFRPEKKLVRAQLVLLGKLLRRNPAAAPAVLPVLGSAFGHEDTDIQERALKLVAAHLPADEALRADLADCAALLSPAHRARATELFGADAAAADTPAGDYRELLPPRPVPTPLAPAPGSVAETVELVAAVVNSATATVAEFERALDGLVRHAHRDRPALAEGLRPALAGRWWLDDTDAAAQFPPDRFDGLEVVAAAVLDKVAPKARRHGHGTVPRFHQGCRHTALEDVRNHRLREAARYVRTAPLPFLLATPLVETGSIEPEELIRRLAEYRRLAVSPAPADFAQALLRVRRDPAAAPAAAALNTRQGDRLAAWLGSAGAPPAVTRRTADARPAGTSWWENAGLDVPHLVLETGERPFVQAELPPEFHPLGRPHTGTTRCHWWRLAAADLAVLPEDRETLAAWLLPQIARCAASEERGAAEILPRLAEAGGPAGEALHLAVATGLGARHCEDRLAAVDALLTLAAREELDAVRLGSDLAELLRLGTVKPNRFADAVRTAAGTGAYATVWAVLAAALPALLTAPAQPNGTGELLAIAADCVEQCGAATPEPDGLAVTAARPGRSRLVTQAGRLRDALHRHSAPPAGS
ncbi:DUF6493 family protein [Streptomyces sp. NPDC051211]|uniref:DUF6493 family protein n=1 Tax=Streptomyces sp. NPDC051211 TaxID=3154643 RepID=UPI00344B054E